MSSLLYHDLDHDFRRPLHSRPNWALVAAILLCVFFWIVVGAGISAL